MTGVRIFAVVIPGSMHRTYAADEGVVTIFVPVDSGSNAGWLRLPEPIAGGPNGCPGSWQGSRIGGEADLWSWSVDGEAFLNARGAAAITSTYRVPARRSSKSGSSCLNKPAVETRSVEMNGHYAVESRRLEIAGCRSRRPALPAVCNSVSWRAGVLCL